MIKQLRLIGIFYKQFLIVSLLLNLLFVFLEADLAPSLFSKAILTVFIFWWYKEPNQKPQLLFYQNLKISAFKLFLVAFLMDSVLLIFLFFIFNLFS